MKIADIRTGVVYAYRDNGIRRSSLVLDTTTMYLHRTGYPSNRMGPRFTPIEGKRPGTTRSSSIGYLILVAATDRLDQYAAMPDLLERALNGTLDPSGRPELVTTSAAKIESTWEECQRRQAADRDEQAAARERGEQRSKDHEAAIARITDLADSAGVPLRIRSASDMNGVSRVYTADLLALLERVAPPTA